LQYPGNIPELIGHHWSSAIAMATPISHKGSTAGAKAHALTALDLLLEPGLVASAREYFAEQTKETKWKSLLPTDLPPPIDLNKEKMERFRPALKKLRYDPSRFRTYLEQLGVKYPTVRE
jgi:aminobenzoyl-glutamate utilization protein B